MKPKDSPVIIIAAARSGTKLLRAVLANSPEFIDFPYDMNYIWKYGNYHIPHDELAKEDITEETRRFIKDQFNKLLNKSNAKRVLEKSVPNSLRVDFVKSIFPECKMIHLYRDGRDVAVDSRQCWQSSMLSGNIQSKTDLFNKIIHFPIVAAWPYLLNYGLTYSKRLLKKEKQVESWGPRFEGIDEASERFSLLEVCGMQWAKSIEHCLSSFSRLEENVDYINVRYETLVRDPLTVLKTICDYLEISLNDSMAHFAKSQITDRYIGYWKENSTHPEMRSLMPHIEKCQKAISCSTESA